MAALMLASACSRSGSDGAIDQPDGKEASGAAPVVTIGPDEAMPEAVVWEAPSIQVDEGNTDELKSQAHEALEAGRLFGDGDADGDGDSAGAIPLYLALRQSAPDDPEVQRGFGEAVDALVSRADTMLAAVEDEPAALRQAQEVGSVLRVVAAQDPRVVAYLDQLQTVEQAQEASLRGERALNQDDIGETGDGGAIGWFRQSLELRPGNARATQGLAAAESALIRRAEKAAEADDYGQAGDWLDKAAGLRPDMDTVDRARAHIARVRLARIGSLRDQGIAALSAEGGVDVARAHLANLLRIAPEGNPAAVELRERIELASHYGLFRPGQVFTEALRLGGRGPALVVIPHGAFRMGASEADPEATDAERPARTIRFDRGLAVAHHEVTVAEFRRFITATGYTTRAARRGYSTIYDERSGNLVRRNGVDWRHDYTGKPAADELPVLHVSARDADAYAEWLADQTGHRYRLPSEAEFEYMLRAGNPGPFPWGEGAPPQGSGNYTGALDASPSGRHWRNAFEGYGDGAWGPAPAASYAPNGYGLFDVAGNVSEWVGDCWHGSYRRAPTTGKAWVNPGCRERVVRGGSWASSPEQTRSSWRLASDANTTNARVGFRVVREI
ncbi:formylglycine-generating enzyme family protein [Lysobacter ciconiae]|uniref:Formylglycine-generating enzyme family protein n=1 Tax=Novilysobacter ciconiae TaxID=2781022 RepID=A0A7S6UHI6_9GAMM|nr:formylglycine-generating enzyme family protein [Lysobacter ciconiae]QOW20411.1 formylglycine-generating enzyme family protein [Lysobacter ciconiae]